MSCFKDPCVCRPSSLGSAIDLITPAKFPFSCETTYSQVLEIRVWTSLGGHYPANHPVCPSGFSISQPWRVQCSVLWSQKEAQVMDLLIYWLPINSCSIEWLSCQRYLSSSGSFQQEQWNQRAWEQLKQSYWTNQCNILFLASLLIYTRISPWNDLGSELCFM